MPSGELEIEEAIVRPQEVVPGGTITVSVTVVERAAWINPGDPSLCNPTGAGTPSGLQCEVGVFFNTGDELVEDSQQQCVPMWNSTNGREEFTFRFDAPENTGSFDVTIDMRHLKPDADYVILTRTAEVSEDGSQGCEIGSDCPSGYVCVRGECIPEDEAPASDSPVGGFLDGLGDVGTYALLGIGGLIAFRGLGIVDDTLDEREDGEIRRTDVLRQSDHDALSGLDLDDESDDDDES